MEVGKFRGLKSGCNQISQGRMPVCCRGRSPISMAMSFVPFQNHAIMYHPPIGLKCLTLLLLPGFSFVLSAQKQEPVRPNIILIYADDLGYGDLAAYGAQRIATPSMDRLAEGGLSFSDAHATSATCTPSRYGLLCGEYPWRKDGTGVAPGNAALLIEPGRTTLATTLQQAGYRTGVVGKWHLGLGSAGGPDWNSDIRPGPLELGFDYAFLLPATGDRVPCVYVENHRVLNLDPADPISVSYSSKVGDEPTGKEHPEWLRMGLTDGHDQTIIGGISRIGYMAGGTKARWVDEEMAAVFVHQASQFVLQAGDQPFFLYLSTHDIHVPRVPNPRFVGKSGMGPRGDAILQLDWTVGQVLDLVKAAGKEENTLIIFSSDNGPVLDDGYADQAWELLGDHRPAGPWRGGKYSSFEAGTRVPLICYWPGTIKPGWSTALISQVDFLASLSALVDQQVPSTARDSENHLEALLGRSNQARKNLVEHSRTFSFRSGQWKLIQPAPGPALLPMVRIESGLDNTGAQLYYLKNDPGEQKNLSLRYPQRVARLNAKLEAIKMRQ